MMDSIRDKLWADIYTYRLITGDVWFRAKEEADRAVKAYDKRLTAEPNTSQEPEKP